MNRQSMDYRLIIIQSIDDDDEGFIKLDWRKYTYRLSSVIVIGFDLGVNIAALFSCPRGSLTRGRKHVLCLLLKQKIVLLFSKEVFDFFLEPSF